MFIFLQLLELRYYFAVRPTPVNMDVMVSECMRDISTDEEVSGDENDSNLLVSNYL
jgi:hypothetical protein